MPYSIFVGLTPRLGQRDYRYQSKGNLSGPDGFYCPMCREHFPTTELCESHCISVHFKQFVGFCCLCTKGFTSISGHRLHQQTHNAMSQFRCDLCDRSFQSNAHLHCHLKRHSDFKEFTCDKCFKSYKHKKTLVKHTCIS